MNYPPITNEAELNKAVETCLQWGKLHPLTALAYLQRQAKTLGFEVVKESGPDVGDVHIDSPLGSGRRRRAAAQQTDGEDEDDVETPFSLMGKGLVPIQKAIVSQRYTFSPVYMPNHIDFHGEYSDPDTLQKAIWDLSENGDRQLNLQHIGGTVSGRWVELACIPWEHEAELTVPGVGVRKVQFPANTPWMGVIWEPWAHDAVQKGLLRGLSIEGTAQRAIVDIELPKVA